MSFHEGFGDGQAQTRPSARVVTDKAVKDRFPLGDRHPRSAVGYGHDQVAVLAFRGDRDRGSRRGVPVGIVEEVGEHLLDQEPVHHYWRQRIGEIDFERTVPEDRPEGGDCLGGQIDYRPLASLNLQHASLISGHIQKAGNQTRQPVRLNVEQSVQFPGGLLGQGAVGIQKR
jgi:hypothetical protein